METRSCKRVAPRQVVLPFEIIIEILSLLSVESLLRFKCVCKQWRLLIQDYKFFVKHRDRTSYVLPLSYRYNSKSHKTVVLSEDDFKLSCHCAGFYVELSVTSQVCRIRNPATRQVLYLPDAPKGTRTLDLAFNSLTGECKVASIYRKKAKTGYLVGLEVITTGKDEKWRPLKYGSPNLLRHGQWLLQKHCCVKDKVEWIVHLPEIIKHGLDLCLQIQSLDPWSERITNTVLSRGVFSDLTEVSFFLWSNCPAVVEIADEALNIMVLEDFKEHKWSPNKITVPFNFLKDNRHLKYQIHFVRTWSEDQLQFYAGGRQLYTYDLKRGSIINDVEYSQIAEEQLARHTSNLMTLKGMKPEGKQ